MRIVPFLMALPLAALCCYQMQGAESIAASTDAIRFDVFRERQLDSVSTAGWLREFLLRQKSGLTGHHEVLSYPFNTCLWSGLIPRKGDHGKDWWRYEQTAYLSDGLIRLGYVMKDDGLVRLGHEGVAYILAHPMENGRLGHPFFESQWPMAVFFRVMQGEYLATKNQLIVEALRKHFLTYSIKELTEGHRHIVNLEGMLWTYGMTGDARLLDLAEKAYQAGGDEMPLERCASHERSTIHGVTFMEEAKIPAILYIHTGKKAYLDAAVNAFKNLDRDHMLPDGVPSSNEHLSGKDPLFSHETCDISDYTWSIGYLLMATGDASWADRIERAVFNAGPGAVSKDFKNLQYFSSVNQVIATGTSNHNKYIHGGSWMAYWPCHETECCAGNVHRFMPNYAARMWMSGRDGGLVAALYGPSTTDLPINNGKDKLTVTESTGYPFADTITFSFRSPSPVATSFTFRTPGWCKGASATINGVAFEGKLAPASFTTVTRTFVDGDKIVLHFPMEATLQRYEHFGAYVERGPILYAYPVAEAVTTDGKEYPSLRGKKSSDPENFPALDIRPAGPWNYALDAASSADLTVVESTGDAYPFDLGRSPISIKVPVRRVVNWTLLEDRYTPPMPQRDEMQFGQDREMITLVPYGSTRLRVTVFPTTR